MTHGLYRITEALGMSWWILVDEMLAFERR
jgi:hypothetical protein